MSFLEKNLEALLTADSALAERVRASAVPEGFQRVMGVDGTKTFARFSSCPKRVHYLGGTSMPVAAAEAITAPLDAGQGNGLGLSIGAGYEWRAFVGRHSSAQALFIYEPDLALLRMALEMCDVSDHLAQRKMILLSGVPGDAAGRLAEILTREIGLEPPTVLHPLPTLGWAGGEGEESAARNAALAAGEVIVRHAVLHRQGQLEALATALQDVCGTVGAANSGGPMAFTVRPGYPAERPLHGHVAREGIAEFRLDRHRTTSLAFRMQALIEHLQKRGGATILSDLLRSQLGCVPARVAVETWIAPLASAAVFERIVPAALGERDRLVVHHADHAARLRAMGVAAAQIDLRLLEARAAGGAAVERAIAADVPFKLKHRVALIADLPRTEMQALGIELPTHQAIFAAARQIVAEEYLTAHAGENGQAAGDILRRAFARSGLSDVQSQDARLRDPLLRIVRDVLLPAIPLHTLAQALLDQNVAVTLLGDWPDFQAGGAYAAKVERVAFQAITPATWEPVALLVHLSPTGVVSPVMFEAVQQRIPIVAPQHPTDGQAGSLTSYLPGSDGFAQVRPGQFVATVASLLRDPGRREIIAMAAARHIARLDL